MGIPENPIPIMKFPLTKWRKEGFILIASLTNWLLTALREKEL
jgi:hypothetical protein